MSLRGPISASSHPNNTALFKEINVVVGASGLAAQCPIWPVRDFNVRPSAPEAKSLPLDQLDGLRFLLYRKSRVFNVLNEQKMS